LTDKRLRLLSSPTDRRGATAVPAARASIVHVLGDADDAPRLAGVAWALGDSGAFEQVVIDATTGSAGAGALADLDVRATVHALDVAGGSGARRVGVLLDALQPALERTPADAVMVHADEHAALAAAIAAARCGLPLVRVGGRPRANRGRVIGRLADLVLVRERADVEPLAAVGVGQEKVRVVGDPLADALQRVDGRRPSGYILALLDRQVGAWELSYRLAELAARTPTIVASSPAVAAAWRGPGAPAQRIPWPGWAERLSLVGGAGALVTDSEPLLEAAALLDLACHDAVRDDPAAIRALRPQPRRTVAMRAGAQVAEAMLANFARMRLGDG
jgi:UDP-N-acetylglucosamine 2-epimerase